MRIHDDIPGFKGAEKNKPFKFNSKYGTVKHYCKEATYNLIENMLENIKNGIFVEIGVFGGCTLLRIYETCMKNNVQIYGIDPWENSVVFNGDKRRVDDKSQNIMLEKLTECRLHLESIVAEHNLNINILHKNSWEVYNHFEDNSIDLMHIDGDHSYLGTKKVIEFYWDNIKDDPFSIFLAMY